MPEPITILLVDDHRVVRQGVRAFLSTQPDLLVVAEAESGAEAVQLAMQYVPDVAMMDLVMPGMDGVNATRLLKQASPRTQVIVLTSYHADEHIFPVLRAGALSYHSTSPNCWTKASTSAMNSSYAASVVMRPRSRSE
jgi:NarL family two-component system response regulator LiaR